MTTRIDSRGPNSNVALLPSAVRTTATPARPFRQVMAASASAVIQSAQGAVTRLPGGPVLAAALRPGPGVSPGLTPEGASSALGAGSSTSPLGSTSGQSVEGVLAQGVDQNMYFLELQERISQESRTYSALSNVLKARHDTVKNAIGNIR
ncbi:MAG: hypothetical protein QM756_28325 [Polyangiaceae bacterium]